jgi:hypothetical protein
MRLFLLSLLTLILALATPALAVDGVLEINQTCAVETGCFAGDTPDFPVTISASGSYRLTSDLALPNNSVIGIDLAGFAKAVTIDLNGFEIRLCNDPGNLFCVPGGSGVGIRATDPPGAAVNVVTVINGTVRNLGAGIALAKDSYVDRVRTYGNRGDGIVVGERSIVTNSQSVLNLGDGIVANGDSRITGNIASNNSGSGIICARIETAIFFFDCVVEGNTVNKNSSRGIVAGGAIRGNVARENNIGIIANGVVTNNRVSFNSSFGLTGPCAYGENYFEWNNGDNTNPQVGTGATEIGLNLCGSDTTCP